MSVRLLGTMILALLSIVLAADRLASTQEPEAPAASSKASAHQPIVLATSAGAPAGSDSLAISKVLQEAWPDRPEWLDMYTAILQDEVIGPDYGWFRTAVTQTRFDWDATRKRLDRNGDNRIAREEFPGPDADFARLDRDRDGALAQPDFDISSREFDFSRINSHSGPAQGTSRGDRFSKATLIRGLFRQEIGSLQTGPKLDEPAPDFTLRTYDGKAEITLSKRIGPKPIVLIFGNFTCGPFRIMAEDFENLHRRYAARAQFLMVYVRETHPTDGARMESNDQAGVAIAQPTTYAERAAVAQRCDKLLGQSFPLLVDTIDDAVGSLYSGMPGRFYLIDREGKIAFKSGRGPFGFKPDELETSLLLMLQAQDSESRAKPATHVTQTSRPVGH